LATPAPSDGSETSQQVVAPGIVEAWNGEVALSAPDSGRIATIVVAEGQTVAAGQLLAVLDDDLQRAAVEIARAEVAEAEAAMARSLHGATQDERQQARADAEADEVRATYALSNARRMGRLGDGHAIAPAEVDRAAAEARTQAAVARASTARLGALEHGTRLEDRNAARARLAAARSRLGLAELTLSRREVRARTASTVLLSRFHAGEFYNQGTAPLFVLGTLSRLQVRLEVDEIDALRLKKGGRCVLYGEDAARIATGTIFRVAPRMGRRGLPLESPTARADVRVREVFVEVPEGNGLIPGRRVWGHADASNS
jgi:HlyD family secretion protein